ncbi:hypothetical protein ACFSJ3_07060 [Corallincola platygyrae]|uniref:Uncharacterized protein n=1 Tax=Corallincola platygyrae TaxID=1193278 RepID=A0ABW4XKX7_9GAMM
MKLIYAVVLASAVIAGNAAVAAESQGKEAEVSSGYCAGLEGAEAVKAEMVSLLQSQPQNSAEIFKACSAVVPEELVSLLDAAMKAAPDEIAALLTAAIEATDPSMHELVFQTALDNGLDSEEALIAALLGGADPTALAEATAAGGDLAAGEGFAAPAPTGPGIGGAGGGSGSVSGN